MENILKSLRGGTAINAKMVVLCVSLIIFGLVSSNSFAADQVTLGKIDRIALNNAGNFPFKVLLTGLPALCSNGANWAYLDDTDTNYKVRVGAMLLAKASGSDVELFTDIDTTSGNCRVGHFRVF